MKRHFFTKFALACAALLLSLLPVSAEEPSFKEFTMYSRDGVAPDAYGDKVIVMFHGFLSANPNGFYKKVHRELKDSYTVVGYNYDYFDVERNLEEFDRFFQAHLRDKSELIFGGSSLGAFWAGYLGDKYQVDKIIMSNPLMQPREDMKRRLGDHFSERRKQHVSVSDTSFDSYGDRALLATSDSKRLVVLTADDDYSDTVATRDYFSADKNATVITFNRGGHSIRYKKNRIAWAILETFVRN